MLKGIEDVEAFGVEITASLTTGATLKCVCQLAGSSDASAYLGSILILITKRVDKWFLTLSARRAPKWS